MQKESIQKETILLTALNLSLYDIISLCKNSAKFNEYVCQSKDFWRQKFNRDYYQLTPFIRKGVNYRNLYEYLNKRMFGLIKLNDKITLVTFSNMGNLKETKNYLEKQFQDLVYKQFPDFGSFKKGSIIYYTNSLGFNTSDEIVSHIQRLNVEKNNELKEITQEDILRSLQSGNLMKYGFNEDVIPIKIF
jgi:hypothetical protein